MRRGPFLFLLLTTFAYLLPAQGENTKPQPCLSIAKACPYSRFKNNQWVNPECISQIIREQIKAKGITREVIRSCIAHNQRFNELKQDHFVGMAANAAPQWDIIDGESSLGVIRDWPKVPPLYQVVDYDKLAQDYDQISFAAADPVTHKWKLSSSPHFKSLSLLQPAYLLDNRWENYANYPDVTLPKNFSESLVVFPGLLSSSLIGSNLTSKVVQVEENGDTQKRTANLIRMIKGYYHSDPVKTTDGLENGLFTDHFHHDPNPAVNSLGGGTSFWYQLVPNVYAMQLQSLYSKEAVEKDSPADEPTLDELTQRMANTLFRISTFLKGSQDLPSFDYAGVLINGGKFQAWDPDCNDGRSDHENQSLRSEDIACFDLEKNQLKPTAYKYEPDAAGSFALIGLMAYERWKDPKYFSMADTALKFLSKYDRNPFYEVELNYGVLAAARMYRHYNPGPSKNEDIHRLMQWVFSRSNKRNIEQKNHLSWPNLITNTRVGTSLLAEQWGEFPVFGLWGGKAPYGKYLGYPFYMNTMAQAVSLAPVAKYYPEYATLLAKYLLHVSSNARFFFPDYIPERNQEPLSLAKLKTLKPEYRAIPYEGLKRDPALGLIASGDPLDFSPRWAETNQSFYSGALTGMFASMLQRTNQSHMPFWDLNRTDFQAPESYPTFLAYNPTDEILNAVLNKNIYPEGSPKTVRSMFVIFDSVSHQFIDRTYGKLRVSLRPGEAKVLSVAPISHSWLIEQIPGSNQKRLIGLNPKSGKKMVLDYNYPHSELPNTLLFR